MRGCVKKPDVYQVPKGTSLRAILRKARPEVLANLQDLPMDRILEESCLIEVPAFEKIWVQIQGAVEENISLELVAGSRLCEIKGKVALRPDADPRFLKRRRLLKNGEIITMPSKCRKIDQESDGEAVASKNAPLKRDFN